MLNSLHFIRYMYNLHYTLYARQSALYTLHVKCVLHTLCLTVCILYVTCTICTLHFMLNSLHFIRYMYNLHFTLYAEQLHFIRYIYNLHFTLYAQQSALYTLHVKCVLHTLCSTDIKKNVYDQMFGFLFICKFQNEYIITNPSNQ